MERKFKLLKDLPGIKAGEILTPIQDFITTPTLTNNGGYYFNVKNMEDCPEWFEEVEEKEFTKSDMLDFATECIKTMNFHSPVLMTEIFSDFIKEKQGKE